MKIYVVSLNKASEDDFDTKLYIEANDFYFEDGKIVFIEAKPLMFGNSYIKVAVFNIDDVRMITSSEIKREVNVAKGND